MAARKRDGRDKKFERSTNEETEILANETETSSVQCVAIQEEGNEQARNRKATNKEVKRNLLAGYSHKLKQRNWRQLQNKLTWHPIKDERSYCKIN